MSDNPGYLYKPEPISFGHGYVPYAPGSCGTNGVWMQEGWCLPGGIRTTNRQRAFAVAVEIDRITVEALNAKAAPAVTKWAATWP